MSHPTDLLPYGEQFAELDLVVRQLDDGSLTVTQDDSLPDGERVHVSASERGLHARLALFACAEPSELLEDALEQLNQRPGVVYRYEAGQLLCEKVLPWAPDYQIPLQTLSALFSQVQQAADSQREQLGRLADAPPEGASAAPGEPAPAPAGAEAAPPPTEGEGAPVGEPLPPSFLPGAGQGEGEGATQRYGAVREVPGRAEHGGDAVASSTYASASSGRHPVTSGGGGGGSGKGKLGAVGTILVVLLVGGVKTALRSARNADEGDDQPVAAASEVPGASEGDDDDFGPLPEATMPERADDPPAEPVVTPSRSDDGAPDEPSQPQPRRDSVYEMAASARADDRKYAVLRWQREGYDRRPQGRLRLLEALSGRIDRETGLILTKSFREDPPGVYESLDCLEHANPSIKRVIVDQLSRRELNDEERTVVAAVLMEQEDTRDRLIDEALIRLGRPREGGLGRLIEARGPEWLKLGDGREILAKLETKDLAALLASKDENVRVLVVDLLGDRGDDLQIALSSLSRALKDDALTVRRRAVEAVGNLRNGRGAWYLALALVREKDRRTEELIRNALTRLPARSTTQYLRKLYKSDKLDNRKAAVSALRSLRNHEAIMALVEAVQDEDKDVRREALEALLSYVRDSDLRGTVAKGVLHFRRIAKDKSDPDARRVARQLCLKIDGRLPR